MKKRILIILVAAMFVVAGVILSRNIASAPKEVGKSNTNAAKSNQNNENKTMKLEIKTTQAGIGDRVVKTGDTVGVYYTGKLVDGKTFDSNAGSGKPFEFTVGQGRVIQGWEQGFIGAKVGEKRTLTIPAELGYGSRGAGGGAIPPNSTLIFDVEVVSIK